MNERLGRMERLLRDLWNASRFAVTNPEHIWMREGKLLPGAPAPTASELPEGWRSFAPGDRWGGVDGHAWFRVAGVYPPGMAGRRVALCCATGPFGGWDDTHSQFLAFWDGQAHTALDCNHRELILTDCAEPGAPFCVDLEGFFESDAHRLVDFEASLAAIDVEAEALYYDASVPLESAKLLPVGDARRLTILRGLDAALDALDLRAPQSEGFDRSVQAARSLLRREVYALAGDAEADIWAIGHTHIDVAWLWTFAQTREKVARSFPSMLYLLERYPDFLFMSSQPKLYAFLREENPAAYREVQRRVREGRWEAEGGMWVEADCNLPCGEALIRQFVYGKRFFREELGVDSRVLWLPDVFGYSVALPQIMKKCGVDYFMTTKISWNDTNQLPVDTFLWEGLDGSRVLTHCVTTTSSYKLTPYLTSYNGEMTAEHVKGCYARYQQKELSHDLLMCYGYGDGGGGTTIEQIETARRFEQGVPGMPRMRHGKVLDFFRKLEQNLRGRDDVPVWVGELYLEYHRGTYTSMAIVKRLNRQCEQALMELETLLPLTGAPAPREALRALWETLLTNQFHDVLPGSAIAKAYEDTVPQLEGVLAEARRRARGLAEGLAAELTAGRDGWLAVNTLGFAHGGMVRLPAGLTLLADGAPLPSQAVEGGRLALLPPVPPKGYAFYALAPAVDGPARVTATPRLLENELLRAALNERGELTSLFDKRAGRELIPEGGASNRLCLYEDRPINFDNWDINDFYARKPYALPAPEDIRALEGGAVRGVVQITWRFGRSRLVQRLVLEADSPMLRFETEADWHEKHLLLRVAFPTRLRSAFATYGTQFGSLARPTHRNTSWEQAKFEVCAHQWADLSEGDYGLSLLDDCKYGHSALGGELSLTLIKCGADPNPTADEGSHRFAYALYPHAGDAAHCDVVQRAAAFNRPLLTLPAPAAHGDRPVRFSLYRLDCDHALLETLKPAEADDAHVLRAYEYRGRTGAARLALPEGATRAFLCDMLETPLRELPIENGAVALAFAPFEIITLRVEETA